MSRKVGAIQSLITRKLLFGTVKLRLKDMLVHWKHFLKWLSKVMRMH